MDLRELKELLEIISERDITEFELEEEGMKLKVKKGRELVATVETNNHHAAAPNVVPATTPALPIPVPVASGPVPVDGAPTEPGVVIVRSPMVGTFYRAPDPSAPSFVNVGDHVKAGQTLCIIEAMKLMNEIESEQAGEIVRVLAENGQPVQYGDELFAIRVSA